MSSMDQDLYSFSSNKDTPAESDFYSNSPTETWESPRATGWSNSPSSQFHQPPEENDIVTRPMTSIGAKGFRSDALQEKETNPNIYGGKSRAPPLKKWSENSPEMMALDMERKINKFIEEAATFCVAKDYMNALEKAKLAEKKERALVKFRLSKKIKEQNVDLQYAVQFTLARMYHANEMYTEAINTYNTVVKNKTYNQSGRLRVNMGNIYFEQQRYPMAIKMYRMALDQIIPAHHRDIRNNIMKNIGISFVKMGQYHDAVQNFEQIVDGQTNTDVQAAFNLLLCYFALGEKKNMKKGFKKLLTVEIPGLPKDEDLDDEKNTLSNDKLRDFLKEKQNEHYDYIFKGAKMIAEVIETDWEKGYDWVIDQLKGFCLKREKCNLASEMEMAKALNYLKHKKFTEAIQSLQAFEKKDKKLQARAATNLSYLYLLKGELKDAERYARLSVEHDKYNAKALVNLGNCLFHKKEFENAKEIFMKALSAEPDSVQAIYNLGLVSKKMKNYQEALQTFHRLNSIMPESIEVIFQIADSYRSLANLGDKHATYIDKATDWYNRLITRVPTDPNILYTLGEIYSKERDDAQSLNFYLESYRYYPTNMDVIKWLGVYFVSHEVYEKALQYFQRASEIEPSEVKWKMMIASCYRRMGSIVQAKAFYERIHHAYPDNVESLEFLVQISHELGLVQEEKQYQQELTKLKSKQDRQQQSGTAAPQSSGDDILTQQLKQFKNQQSPFSKPQPSEPTFSNGHYQPNSPSATTQMNREKIEKDDEELLKDVDSDSLMDMLGL